MKPADDATLDYRALVEHGYDQCAAAYDRARRGETEPALSMLAERLPDGAMVLDVGCGPGMPVTKALARRFIVTGVDISAEMIKRARVNVPEATFVHGDITSVDLPGSNFDAVVAFYSIFHLPRQVHEALFVRIWRWLKPGGYMLATVGLRDESAYTEGFFDATMYWSNYGLETYTSMLERLGFDLLTITTIGHGYEETHPASEECHPLIFARKRVA